MRIAVTADLHWGHGPAGDAATRLLVEYLHDDPPDVLLLGGDIGTADHFSECLRLLSDLHCTKALTPGNHDLWVHDDDGRGDSLDVYEQHLPNVCAAHGVQYLDRAPLVLAQEQLAIVGTINWYDYSWSLARLQVEVPDWEWRLQRMAFSRGRHNDRRFVRWPLDDVRFTEQVTAAFERQLVDVLGRVERVLVITHHPAFYDLSFPRPGPPSVPDGLLWDAFSGNTRLEDVLRRHAERIAIVFSGHTHRARTSRFAATIGHNIGGDYHFKRLLAWTWPGGELETHQFGDA